ncbi:DMT family transporter [Nocardia altamirensis]|uniref:DMT family transporter n=1 Tax=Nocardia altamirensis TaxID=472158 RepID=UPI00083FDE9E|nr:DMT family transporter [Nocardia altamirensis]
MLAASRLALIALAAIWGSNFLLVDVALEGADPAQIVAARLWLGGAILLACCLVMRRQLPRGWGIWARLLLMGVLGQALPWLLFAWGQQQVSVSMAGIYNSVTPLASLPVVWLLLRHKGSRGEVVASVLGFGGIIVLMAPWGETSRSSLAGQLACLAGAVCYAVAYAYAKHLISTLGYSKVALAASQAIVAGLLMLVVTAPQLARPMDPTAAVVGSLVAMGVGTAVAFLLNYWLIGTVGPLQAGLAFYLMPLVAVGLGIGVRGDVLHVHQIVGAAVVFAALALQYAIDRHETLEGQGPQREPEPVRVDVEPAYRSGDAGSVGRSGTE